MTYRYRVALLIVTVSPAAFGHHSGGYLRESSELQGEVVEILWRNPHLALRLRVESASGEEAVWEMESIPATLLNRRGFSRDSIAVGDLVRIVGRTSRLRENQMWITEAWVGSELAFTMGGNTGDTLADEDYSPERVSASRKQADGIFRVWDWFRASQGGSSGWPNPLPLTDAAESARQQWNLYVNDATLRCVPPGMPRAIYNNGLPIEFVDDGDAILMHLEEFDAVRTIHMTREPPGDQEPGTPLGYSIGWWEDGTMVVHTTRISYPYFSRVGVPQSDEVEIMERFTLSEDESVLDYQITLTDPNTFTEPVNSTKRWIWRPGLELRDYDCAYLEQAQ